MASNVKRVSEMTDRELETLRTKMVENIRKIDLERERRRSKSGSSILDTIFGSGSISGDDAVKTRKRSVKSRSSSRRGGRSSKSSSKKKIKGTNADMKYVLERNGVSFAKSLKKAELERLVRKHHLVKKVERRAALRT